MPPNTPVTRRDFLNLLTRGSLALSGLLGVGMALKYLGFQNEPEAQTRFDLGPAENFPPGSSTPVPQANAVVLHKTGELTALSLVCTHLGCIVQPKEAGYACPCHGSRFGADGQVQRGPASRPLQNLRLETSADGHLILYTQ